MSKANILEYDLEMFPAEGYTWSKWDTNIIEFTRESMICSVAYRWAGEKSIHCIALPDFSRYKVNKFDNGPLMRKFSKVLNRADITIAHNGIGFDERKSNTDMVKLGLTPPPPHKVIDTLRVARKKFGFMSNKLDDLAISLGLRRKVKHPGFAMWKGCMDGNMSSWRKMIRYNIGDIDVLHDVYLRLRPWMTTHPNLTQYTGASRACTACGSENILAKHWAYYAHGRKRRYQCQEKDCGKWMQDSSTKKETRIK